MQHLLQTKSHAKIRPNLCRLALLLILCMIACAGSGCCRLAIELRSPIARGDYNKPENRFYVGTRLLKRDLDGPFLGPLALPFFPGEIIADTLFLPVDCIRYLNFKCNPPLAYYIEQNDLESARKKLEAGADPNAIDYRVSRWQPVIIAKDNNSLAALKLLAKHKAKIPSEFIWISPNNLDFYLEIFKNRLFDANEWKASIKGLIFTWIPRQLSQYDQDRLDKHIELITLLLEQGFSPNDMDDNALRSHVTALDILLNADYNGLDKSRLINLLKAHGAKTYLELAESNPELPHLNKKGLDIHPAFKSFVEKIEKSDQSELYRLSTSYPEVDCPVLVIDMVWNKSGKEQIRTTRIAHRRKTPTEWDQNGEPFEIPVLCRVVLTPPGRKVSSSLHDGMPSDNIIHEKWHTFPEYEVYVQNPIPQYEHPTGIFRILNEIKESGYVEWGWKENAPFGFWEFNTLHKLIEQANPAIKSNWMNKRWQDKAGLRLKEIGIEGNWLHQWSSSRVQNHVFDTHRKTEDIRKDIWDIVPYPTEIMISINRCNKPNPNAKEDHQQSTGGHDGRRYWNWQYHGWPGKGGITILYGDEVSEETIEKIKNCLYEIM